MGPVAFRVLGQISDGVFRHFRDRNAAQNIDQCRLSPLPHRMNAAPRFSVTRETGNQTLIEPGWTFDRFDHLEQGDLLAAWPQTKSATCAAMGIDDPSVNESLQDFGKEAAPHPCGVFQRRQLRHLPFGKCSELNNDSNGVVRGASDLHCQIGPLLSNCCVPVDYLARREGYDEWHR